MADLGAIGVMHGIGKAFLPIAHSTVVHRSPLLWARKIITHGGGVKLPAFSGKAYKLISHSGGVKRPVLNHGFKRIPWWTSDGRPLHTIPTTGRISGSLARSTVALHNAPVHLYYHKNGYKVETVYSVNGYYQFDSLDPGDYYFVVASDFANAPPSAYNAGVFDYVNPIVP